MLRYRKDYKLEDAKKLIDSLDDSKENELIKYYIQKNKENFDKQAEKLKEYRDWFKTLDRLLPNKNIIMR